jgi:hypothetical protein
VLARSAWVVLVALTLAIFLGSLPIYLAQLQMPCAGVFCQYYQLPPTQVEALQRLGWSLDQYAALQIPLMLFCVGVALVVSALIVWRRSDDRMAMLVAFMLVPLGPLNATSSLPIGFSFWVVANESLSFLGQVLLILVFLVFPTGQFVPRWTRWIFSVFVITEAPFTFFNISLFGPYTAFTQPGWLFALVALVLIALVQLYRYRRVSTPRQRQQTKWVVFGFATAILITVIAGLLLAVPFLAQPGSLYPLVPIEASFLLPLLPALSFGVAVLRYRLWDIDALINRALVYGLLTALLGALYAGLIIGLTSLTGIFLGPTNQPVILVISTLAIAALFVLVRKRIQSLIDQRFYRKKYDAEKTLAAFNATLRTDADLAQVREHLLRVVQETMQPAQVSLWLRQPERDPGDLPHHMEPQSQLPPGQAQTEPGRTSAELGLGLGW